MNTTSPSLLERLRRPGERDAWPRFVQLYTPLLMYWARRAGLNANDAAELTQEVFVALIRKLPKFAYDPGKSFRAWLRTVAMNQLRDQQRKRRPATQSDSALDNLGTPDTVAAFWEGEDERWLAARALNLMRTEFSPETWHACLEHILNDRPAADVAAELGISVNAIYVMKCRVIRKLRHELAGLID